jgi:hypothetical protein
MYYPTHSTSMIVSVTGAYATHVSCMGYVDRHDDGVYNPENNVWRNPFSNETAMCRMSDGSIMRINEFRRVACSGERVSLYGTEGSYEEQSNANVWVTKFGPPEDLRQLLECADIPAEQITGPMSKVTDNTTHRGASKVHPLHLLPREFIGLPNGHNGSHQFLVHDFVTACISGERPPNDVYQAARYLVPGLIAHESAKQGGVLLEVPDFGTGK